MNGHQLVAHTLRAQSVDTMFGLMGDANMQHVVQFIDGGGRFIGSVSEGSAVSMAHGYARTSGRLGVVSVTHGPAVTNTLTALTEVARAGGNVVLLTAGTGPDHLQWIDLRGAAALAGASYCSVDSAATLAPQLADVLRGAADRHVPVLVDIPVAVQNARDIEADPGLKGGTDNLVAPADAQNTDEADLDAALGMLFSARRPVVVAGRGAAVDGARDDIVALADLLQAPLATTLQAKNFFDDHPFNLGILGTLAHATCTETVLKADCVLSFGASLNRRTTVDGSLLDGKSVIDCTIEPAGSGQTQRSRVTLRGGAGALARRLAKELQAADFAPSGTLRTERLRSDLVAQAGSSADFPATAPGTMDMRAAARVLDELLPAARVLVTDSGRFTRAPWHHVRVKDPRHFVYTTSFGSIGLGVATAVGAAVGSPGHVTLGVVGDGGGMMGITEFSTAVRHEIPLLLVVMNDGSYGSEFSKLTSYGLDPRHSLISWPSFADLGTAMGGRGRTAHDTAELRAALTEYLASPTPTVLDIACDPTVDLYAGER